MGNPGVTEAQAREALDALEKAGGVKEYAARALGLHPNTYRNRLKRASQMGLVSRRPVMDGFEITKTTAVLDEAGNITREFVQQKPERELSGFNLPEGHAIKGVSAYLDGSGNVIGQWVKTREGERDPVQTAEVIKAAFDNWQPKSPNIISPTDCDSDRLTAYIFCDWHLGLYAYGKETDGPDWDLSIAQGVISETIRDLVDQAPKSSHALILGLGDLLHADNARNQTEKSGNVLDVDTRYDKCLETLCDMLGDAVEIVATKHSNVEATFKPGNHDPYSTVGIRQAMRMLFRGSEHVAVDTSPDAFYWKRFGVNLIGGTHGDKAKIPQLPLVMANRRPADWAETSTRHFHTAHIHHNSEKEDGGVSVFSHRAPVAQDVYHAHMGYLSGRSMKSYYYHAEKGSKGHNEVEIK